MLDVSFSAPVDGESRQSDIAFEMLKADIVACRILPGAHVSEGDLAARYQLGKAPIRTALARFCERDWLRALPRRGYLVKPVAMRDITEIFDLRRVLEPKAARLAIGQVDLGRLTHLDAVCGAGFVAGDPAGEATFLQAHRQFHLSIAQATGSRRLLRTLEQLWDETERVVHYSGLLRRRGADLHHDHRGLLDAFAKGSGAAAEAEAAEEVEHLYRLIVDAALKTAILLQPAAMTAAEGGESIRW